MVKFINTEFDFNQKVTFSFKRVIFLTIVLFSLGLAVGAAWYSSKIKSIKPIELKFSSVPTPVAMPTPVADNISDWQVYRNEEYGFEVKYPIKDWVINEYQDDNCSVLNDKDQKNCIYFANTVFGHIIINISNFSAKENLNEFLEFQQSIPEIYRQKDTVEVLLDGHKGYKVYSGGWGEVPEEGNTIYLEKDKISSFIIRYSFSTNCYFSIKTDDKTDPKFIKCDKSVKKESETIDQILSTLKFLN